MTFMRYLSPTMDHLFMDSLAWVDSTYITKHKGENPDDLRAMYYPNLKLYDDAHGPGERAPGEGRKPYDAMMKFLARFGRKGLLSLAVYLATFVPYVGRFVLPAASFYTFNKAVGTPAAVVIFGSGILVPKRYLIMFLQSYFSSRSLMRDLVCPKTSDISYFLRTDSPSARSLLLPHPLQLRPTQAMVPRPRGRPLWLRRGLLHPRQDPVSRRARLRNRRSLDRLSSHENHGAPAAAGRREGVQGE